MKKKTLALYVVADIVAGYMIHRNQQRIWNLVEMNAGTTDEVTKSIEMLTALTIDFGHRLSDIEDDHSMFEGDIVVPDGDPEALIIEVTAVQHPGLIGGVIHFDIVAETDDGESFRLGRCSGDEKSHLDLDEFKSLRRVTAKRLFIERLMDLDDTVRYAVPGVAGPGF